MITFTDTQSKTHAFTDNTLLVFIHDAHIHPIRNSFGK